MTEQDREQLLFWLGALEGGVLSDQDQAKLIEMLRSQETARRIYIDYTAMSSSLIEYSRESVSEDEDRELDYAIAEMSRLQEAGRGFAVDFAAWDKHEAELAKENSRRALHSKLYIVGGIAAVLVLAVLVGIVSSVLSNRAAPGNSAVVVHTPADSSTRIVARLTDTRNAQWRGPTGDDIELTQGDALKSGLRVELVKGFAELTTNAGAVALVEAPAKLELLDRDNALYLHEGQLVGRCETPSSKGFLVRTSFADIIDVGTEFGVNVSEERLTTTVFTGEVEVRVESESMSRPVFADQTVSLAVEGGGV